MNNIQIIRPGVYTVIAIPVCPNTQDYYMFDSDVHIEIYTCNPKNSLKIDFKLYGGDDCFCTPEDWSEALDDFTSDCVYNLDNWFFAYVNLKYYNFEDGWLRCKVSITNVNEALSDYYILPYYIDSKTYTDLRDFNIDNVYKVYILEGYGNMKFKMISFIKELLNTTLSESKNILENIQEYPYLIYTTESEEEYNYAIANAQEKNIMSYVKFVQPTYG